MSAAKATIQFIERLTISQGRHAGKAFTTLPWQRRFLRGALAPGVAESALSVGRGNGKSTLIAGVACAALDGPLAEDAAEIVIVASSHEQAGLIFRHVQRFLQEDIDRKKYRVWDSPNTSRLMQKQTGTMLQVKGSDPKRLHGAAPSLILADELAQWPRGRIEEMLAALRTASGKIVDARLMMIGTRPADETHPFAVALRDADYVQCHAAGPDGPLFQRSTWKRANPSLDHMPDLEGAIRREAKGAKRDPALLQAFKALRLNMGVADTHAQVLVSAETWRGIEGEAEAVGPCVWGIDLGGSAAQSAVAAYYPTSGLLVCMAAFPNEPSLAERGLRDGVGALYQRMQERGELIVVGGAAVDIVGLLREALRRFGPPSAIACDRWRGDELFDALDKSGIPRAAVEFRGQGYKDGGEDVRLFRRAVMEGKVTPSESLLLRSAMSEARVVSDLAGNEKLAKAGEGGRRTRARDDACAASILAVALGSRRGAAPVRAPRFFVA